jgi:hypothetical protein
MPGLADNSTCKVYALKELGDDPELCKWIAETIPNVIKPGSWNLGEKQRISYYGQGRILVVYHNEMIQSEVAAFLEGLKKAMPQEKQWASGPHAKMPAMDAKVAHAAWHTPASMPPMTNPAYPIPAPLQHPKHLFHLIVRAEGIGDFGTSVVKELSGDAVNAEEAKEQRKAVADKPSASPSVTFILRYEGEGIIDNTVADVLKEIYGPKNAEKNAPPGPCPVPSYSGTSVGSVIDALAGPALRQGITTVPAPRNMTPATEPAPGPSTVPVPEPLPGPRAMPPATETLPAPRAMPPAANTLPVPTGFPPPPPLRLGSPSGW